MKSWMLSPFLFGVTLVAAGAAPDDQRRSKEEILAEQSGCLRCHAVDKKVVGPSFRDIAARYKNAPRSRETLRAKVKNGGKGNWTDVTGGVLMPPHSGLLPESLIVQLVDWVLSR